LIARLRDRDTEFCRGAYKRARARYAKISRSEEETGRRRGGREAIEDEDEEEEEEEEEVSVMQIVRACYERGGRRAGGE